MENERLKKGYLKKLMQIRSSLVYQIENQYITTYVFVGYHAIMFELE